MSFQGVKCVDYHTICIRQEFRQEEASLVATVFSIEKNSGQVVGGDGRDSGEMNGGGSHVLEALGGEAVDSRKVEEDAKAGSATRVEDVTRNAELCGDVGRPGAEKIDHERQRELWTERRHEDLDVGFGAVHKLEH